MSMTIKELSNEVEEVSKIYASRFGLDRDDVWFLLKLQEEVGELTQAFLAVSGRSRTRDRNPEELEVQFRKEIADVFCHVLLLARHHSIDIEAEVDDKWLAWRRS